jgi:hypothetical protein
MAAPTDSARQPTNVTTANTSHAINVGSPAAGTLLIVFVRYNTAPGTVTFVSTNGTYVSLISDSSDASNDTTEIFYRMAQGNEGATDTMTTGNSVKLGAICWEVTGAANAEPEVSLVNVGTTTANTCQSNNVVPAGPPQDTLYISMGGADGEASAFTGAPASYANLQAANSGTGGLPATNVFMGGASRQINASSGDDAGVFTHGAATTGWTAFAIAIKAPLFEIGVADSRAYLQAVQHSNVY